MSGKNPMESRVQHFRLHQLVWETSPL